MKSPNVLLLHKNLEVLRRELDNILSKKSKAALAAAVRANVMQLFSLGTEHFTFASSLGAAHWRQVVSRSYYGAYCVSRAVRLAVCGQYSSETNDHQRVGELPDDFPERNTFANRLRLLRDDRNLCDYDHTVVEDDLGMRSSEARALVEQFIASAAQYLAKRRFRVNWR